IVGQIFTGRPHEICERVARVCRRCDVRTRPLRSRRTEPGGVTAIVRLHAVSTAADACIALALAGSLFFNTSLEVARPRLALYLALTLVPVAIMTPLIGPTVARYGAGSRLLVRIQRARVACALLLALAAGSVVLYPLSLAVLVLGRVYTVVKRS